MINTTRKVYDKTGMGFQLLQRKMLWRWDGIPFSLSVKPHCYGFDSFVESEFFMP